MSDSAEAIYNSVAAVNDKYPLIVRMDENLKRVLRAANYYADELTRAQVEQNDTDQAASDDIVLDDVEDYTFDAPRIQPPELGLTDEQVDAVRATFDSLREMVLVYGTDDGYGPIPIIERAKLAIGAFSTYCLRNK